MKPQIPTAVVTDFDGTVTTCDVGDAICLNFGAATREEVRLSYAKTASVKLCMRRFFARLAAEPDAVRRFVLSNTVMRDGFAPAARRLARAGVPLEIASGGLDIYIGPLLKKWGVSAAAVFCGRARHENGRFRVTYPQIRDALEQFKAARVRHYKKRGCKVIFCGDATSDLKAASQADTVFACGRLSALCREAGIKARRLHDFGEVARAALES
ncbi:MAG: HAD-IB family phosphatase [Elusimicrobiales bacterium]|nr:HAD-IB family phosphatase [Elusimicrobiales bacterium]